MRVSSVCLGQLATNCYLVEIGGTTVLVDPAEDSDRLADFVGERTIDAVVLTHGHFDHVGGAWAFPDATVHIHPADRPFVDHAHPDRPEIVGILDEAHEIAPGLRVLHTPGHSPGSVCLYAEADGVLFGGDLLFAGSIGRTDFPGGDPRVMRESLRRIVALDGDPTVYPGHGEITTLERERQTNPYLLMMG